MVGTPKHIADAAAVLGGLTSTDRRPKRTWSMSASSSSRRVDGHSGAEVRRTRAWPRRGGRHFGRWVDCRLAAFAGALFRLCTGDALASSIVGLSAFIACVGISAGAEILLVGPGPRRWSWHRLLLSYCRTGPPLARQPHLQDERRCATWHLCRRRPRPPRWPPSRTWPRASCRRSATALAMPSAALSCSVGAIISHRARVRHRVGAKVADTASRRTEARP